jgi:hypothetical protein
MVSLDRRLSGLKTCYGFGNEENNPNIPDRV